MYMLKISGFEHAFSLLSISLLIGIKDTGTQENKCQNFQLHSSSVWKSSATTVSVKMWKIIGVDGLYDMVW